MIVYPKLKEKALSRKKLETFKGYDKRERIDSGSFCQMENLVSDHYPVLSPRKKRGCVCGIQDVGPVTGVLYVPEVGMFFTDNHQEDHSDDEYGELHLLDAGMEIRDLAAGLLPGTKSLTLMGKTLIIAPDMIAVDTDTLMYEQIKYEVEVKSEEIQFQICREDGKAFSPMTVSYASPKDPNDGDYWLDSDERCPCLRQYSATGGSWSLVDSTWVKIQTPELESHKFRAGDGISISGIGMKDGAIADDVLYELNGSHMISSVDRDSIVIEGFVAGTGSMTCDAASVVAMTREVPELDFIVESGNRLWGCARNVNEIYACKLGDYKSWNCFQGLSTDSWVGSVGTPGAFTGAVVQNGYPIFYKETCKHKVWPSATGAHQITSVTCDGVQKDCENSLAVYDGRVFYKSALGVFADDGGGPVEIGQCLGNISYHNASGAVYDRKYYLNMKDGAGSDHLFVYDLQKGLWHCESGIAGRMIAGGNILYGVENDVIWDLTGNTGTPEESVSWMAVTGDLGLELPEQKYITRLTLRLSLEPGATFEVYAQYDREQTWVKLGQVYGTELRSISLPVRPRRCDQLRLKLQGTGMCKLYSITQTLEKGSELT